MIDNLHLATSCLIGRPDDEVLRDLLALSPDGLQLCPGFEAGVDGVSTRTHHGYTPGEWRSKVWQGGALAWSGDSMHPPRRHEAPDFMESISSLDVCLETMYHDYWLGCGEEIEVAMSFGIKLAVDISHLWIQVCSGVISRSTLRRLMDYPNIMEVHISANNGRNDSHRPCTGNEMLLEWGLSQGAPVVLECNMHKMSTQQRVDQVEMLRTRVG